MCAPSVDTAHGSKNKKLVLCIRCKHKEQSAGRFCIFGIWLKIQAPTARMVLDSGQVEIDRS